MFCLEVFRVEIVSRKKRNNASEEKLALSLAGLFLYSITN
jgi:hypothetical protein